MKKTLTSVVILGVLLIASMTATVQVLAQGAGLEREIQDVEKLLQDARDRHIQIIAPSYYEKAEKKLQEAKARFDSKGKIENIRTMLAETRTELKQAETFRDVGELILRDAIVARQEALTANAPEHAAAEWKNAKEALYQAGREIEKGNHNNARARAADSVRLLKTAELEGIRNDLLGEARSARDTAFQDKADKKAAATYAAGERHLAAAEAILREDRYDREAAAGSAVEAIKSFRHARDIVAVNRRLERGDSDIELEKLVLEHEQEIASIADAVNVGADFAAGRGQVLDGIKASIVSLRSDRDALRSEVGERDARIAGLKSEQENLSAQLGKVSGQERQAAASLLSRQERDSRMAKVRGLFAKNEAEIVTRGDELMVRLYGISFPVGSSEIRPQDFGVLTRVQQVLREFPAAEVTVEGHTDSSGDDDYNMQLSDRRALAVKSYLDANMGLSADRISAKGSGETSPIANNETEAGRARNRRIEVRLLLPPIGQ
ncbi:OmpA family protein [bacterium]|nr:OmpA family protein [bacterium]MBU1676461.1 OmpA family protein [bacterium]